MASVAAIILNWNGREDTLQCLQALVEANAYRPSFASSRPVIDRPDIRYILVVDNGSTDGSVEAIARRFPEVTTIENGHNLGWAAGNNVGIRWALSRAVDYVLLLNNDALVEPGFLEPLVEFAERNKSAGAVGPKVYLHDTPRHISFAGAQFSPHGELSHPGFGQPDLCAQSIKPIPTAYIPGCALLIRREALERVGLLDEDFYLLFEDVDWCFRARRAGYESVMVPSSIVWHKESHSFGSKDAPRYLYYFARNHLLFIWRNMCGTRRLSWLYHNTLMYLKRWGYYVSQAGDVARAEATALSLADFWRRRLGEQTYPWMSGDWRVMNGESPAIQEP